MQIFRFLRSIDSSVLLPPIGGAQQEISTKVIDKALNVRHDFKVMTDLPLQGKHTSSRLTATLRQNGNTRPIYAYIIS